jgi:CRISPR-associated protein Cas1
MLNEFAYCPRLYYLEHVQGEWRHSEDTIEGRFAHRRVDREEGRISSAEDASEDRTIHARSVTVGSSKTGAVARIDLIEGEGRRVTPVDYKRGEPPSTPERSWEPERVQLCLQGLILRDNGYECDEGLLYFVSSQERVRVPFSDELIRRTLDLLSEARQVAAAGVIPPPLVNSPKCPRCSLASICLPDEINLLRASEPQTRAEEITLGQRAEPRRLMPARDDHLAVYVQGQGCTVGLKGDVLEIREKGKTISEARLMEMSQLNLRGNVQLSAQALRELAARQIPVLHLSYGGWLAAVTTAPPHKNIELRRRQFEAAADRETCLAIARQMVSGKIRNSRTLLRRNAREELEEGVLAALARLRHQAERASSLEQLLGIEGAAARIYFSQFARMLRSDEGGRKEFDFESRNRRPPRDPVNALLSFLYAMLVKDFLATVIGVGFDPYLGFYHQPRYGRPALALDLMEEFRPIVADSVAIGMINNQEIRATDFIRRAGAAALTDSGRKRVIEAYERRLDGLVTHPRFGYTISYRRVFEVQARLLARLLGGEIAAYPPFCTR